MARGHLAGGWFFQVLGVILLLIPFGRIYDAWVVQRTELYKDECWRGSGLYHTNVVHGADISGVHVKCSGVSSTTYNTYCDNTDPNSYSSEMCRATRSGKILHVASILLGGISLLSISYWRLNQKYWPTLLGSAVFSLTSALCSAACFFVMITSAMFSKKHLQSLGADLAVPYKTFECKFQSPMAPRANLLRWLEAFLVSQPTECLFIGPSVVLFGCSAAFGIISFILLTRFVWEIRKVVRRGDSNLQQGLLRDESCRLPRRYTLYGAFLRRLELSKWNPLAARLTGALPPLIVVANMVMLGLWMVYGLQFAVTIQVGIQKSPSPFETQLPSESEDAKPFWLTESIISSLKTELQLATANFTNLDDQKKIWAPKFQIYDFTPFVVIRNTWDGGSYLSSILTAISTIAWPICKASAWVYFWYIPSREVTRGRFLTLIDWLGKWMLVGIFNLCILCLAFLFDRNVRFPRYLTPLLVPKNYDLDYNLRFHILEGFGSWGFVVNSIWALAIGQAFVILHSKSKQWEEERLEEFLKNLNTETNQGEMEMEIQTQDVSTFSHKLGVVDTPYIPVRITENLAIAASSRMGFSSLRQRLSRSYTRNSIIPSDSLEYTHREALCARKYTPVFGKQHKFSTKGKLLMLTCVLTCLLVTFTGMMLDAWKINRLGLVAKVFVPKQDQEISFSVASSLQTLPLVAGPDPSNRAWAFTAGFFVFGIFIPLVYVGLLGVAFFAPLTLREQRICFQLLELLAAWNALDVFLLALLSSSFDIESISLAMMRQQIPIAQELALSIFPNGKGVYYAQQSFLTGFWWLIAGSLMEKLLTAFVVPLAATALTERRIIKIMREIYQNEAFESTRTNQDQENNSPFIQHESPLIQHELNYSMEPLEQWSPAARYPTASALPDYVYAGAPRINWRIGIRLGLMKEERTPRFSLD